MAKALVMLISLAVMGAVQAPPPNSPGAGTAVRLTVGTTVIRATLNDSETAKRLIARLPLKISMVRSSVDYCGTIASLQYANADLHRGWKNGDVVYIPNGNWFSIFFGGENDRAPNFITVGRIDKEDLSLVAKLEGSIEMTIAVAGSH